MDHKEYRGVEGLNENATVNERNVAPISDMYHRIDSYISDLKGNLHDLEMDLTAILGPSHGPEATEGDLPIRDTVSEMARGLGAYGDQLRDLIYKVQEIRSRVEL